MTRKRSDYATQKQWEENDKFHDRVFLFLVGMIVFTVAFGAFVIKTITEG